MYDFTSDINLYDIHQIAYEIFYYIPHTVAYAEVPKRWLLP